MKKRRIISLLIAALLLASIPVNAIAATTVSDIIIPVKETYFTRDRQDGATAYNGKPMSKFYYGKENFVPTFYDTLTAKTPSGDVILNNIKWKCDNFDITKNGTYHFSIDTSSVNNFILPLSVIEKSKITVHVVDTRMNKISANMYTEGLPVRAKMIDNTYMRFYDLTGINFLPLYNVSGAYINTDGLTATKVSVFSGASADPINTDSHIVVDNCKLLAVYCGGNTENATYTGNSLIELTGSSSVSNIYGGGIEAVTTGHSTIKISDSSNVGGIYSDGAKSLHIGDTTIELDDNVRIGHIEKGSSKNTAIHVSSNFKFALSDIFSSDVSVYVNGVKVTLSNDILVDTSDIKVGIDTPLSKIPFPTAVKATVDGKATTIDKISWVCKNYKSNTAGKYTFSLNLPSDYLIDPFSTTPTIDVFVGDFSNVQISSLKLPCQTSYLPIDYKGDINFYTNITATAQFNNDPLDINLSNVKWICENFDSSKIGIYSFTIDPKSLPENIKLRDGLIKSSAISVRIVDRVPTISGSNVYANSLPVSIHEDSKYFFKVCDVSGCITFFDSIPSSGIVYGGGVDQTSNTNVVMASGKVAAIYGSGIGNSQAAFINIMGGEVGAIYPYGNINGAGKVLGGATVTLHPSLISKIKYNDADSKYVTVNGVNMSVYDGIKGSVNNTNAFAHGVPAIVREVNGQTYLYRANSDTLLISTPITYFTLYGGSVNEDIESTNITMESGILSYIYGGTAYGSVKGNVTFVMNGGTVRFTLYGGSLEGYADSVYFELNEGYAAKSIAVGGNRAVVGKKGNLGNAIEIVQKGGFTQGYTLGMTGNIQSSCINGNIKFTMTDGICTTIYAGSKYTPVYGNVNMDITGGYIQNIYQDGTSGGVVKGHTNIEIYKSFKTSSIVVTDSDKITIKRNDSSYMLVNKDFTVNNDGAYNTSDDSGKLNIRVLEMRPDSEPKDTYMPTKTGDCIIVAFPNGQIMLIDTGTAEAGDYIVKDLKELGIKKIDFLVITHYHSDHTGSFEKILQNFDVDMLLLPNYKAPVSASYKTIQKYTDKYKTNYLSRGDSFSIGNVKIEVFNPDTKGEELKSYEEAEANNLSMVFKMTYKNTSALFTGDTYEEIETELAKVFGSKLKADFLKVPHHGITSSSCYNFINAIAPSVAVITNLQTNTATVKSTQYALKNNNHIKNVLATGDYGTVLVTLDGNSLKYKTQYKPKVDIGDYTRFTDIVKYSWYESYVALSVEQNLFGGTSDTLFEPDAKMTRAMFVTVLARLSGVDTASYKSNFSDVGNTWYTGAVAWAAQNNIVNGIGDNKFDPNANITREQLCVMLIRYAKYADIDLKENQEIRFADEKNIGGWAYDAVQKAALSGLVGGIGDDRFEPRGNATRAQVATIIIRLINLK